MGIIPARGGSKGVKRKNVRLVAGKPLIAYTIQAAGESALLSHFVTSTEDGEIAACARQFGSPVLMRPEQIAEDTTPMIPVVQHAIVSMEESGIHADYIVLLQPTTPLRNASDIDSAISLLMKNEVDSVISVYQVSDHHPSRMYSMDDNGFLNKFYIEPSNMLRQDLAPLFHRNGAIYACKKSVVMEENTLIGSRTMAYVMPKDRSINIDDEIDLSFASYCLSSGGIS